MIPQAKIVFKSQATKIAVAEILEVKPNTTSFTKMTITPYKYKCKLVKIAQLKVTSIMKAHSLTKREESSLKKLMIP